ncbi:PIN domain-containing protein [Aerosakkonemataceae cyanobacterium BLCC-F50]|uniref:PIN domain-containing protein n=1 Tax=Floridaenema flaviceps BLCC-F50 TaxID=3153642 RepID=A0ABV4XIP0_9CYAN
MILIVDANILIGELLRQRGQNLIQNPELMLYITEQVLDEIQYEIRRRIPFMVSRGRLTEADAQLLLAQAIHLIETKITVITEPNYIHLETEARNRIPRDPNDWSTVALALLMNAAIWTQDCDFLGCGCPTWTTETLLIQMQTNQI